MMRSRLAWPLRVFGSVVIVRGRSVTCRHVPVSVVVRDRHDGGRVAGTIHSVRPCSADFSPPSLPLIGPIGTHSLYWTSWSNIESAASSVQSKERIMHGA